MIVKVALTQSSRERDGSFICCAYRPQVVLAHNIQSEYQLIMYP